jgi:hypothetical protein
MRLGSSIAPVTAANSATLATTPLTARRRSAASRQRRSPSDADGDAGVAEAAEACRFVATGSIIATQARDLASTGRRGRLSQ